MPKSKKAIFLLKYALQDQRAGRTKITVGVQVNESMGVTGTLVHFGDGVVAESNLSSLYLFIYMYDLPYPKGSEKVIIELKTSPSISPLAGIIQFLREENRSSLSGCQVTK